jgi:hypothetical protein
MSRKEPEADNEELKAFVSSSLRAIMAAVSNVREAARAKSAHGTGEWAFSPPDKVEFDVAVQAKRTGQTGGGLKVQVFSVGANARKDVAHENSTVSRIRFTVPAKFKKGKVQEGD